MRTDSTRVSNDALAALRQFIGGHYGKNYVPGKPNSYRSKKGAQDAHEAIRPTSLEYTPERVRPYLRRDAFQLYSLIWDRFVASQMVPAVFDQTSFEIPVREALFRATGQQIKFDGFMKVYIEGRDAPAGKETEDGEEEAERESQDSDGVLPDLQRGFFPWIRANILLSRRRATRQLRSSKSWTKKVSGGPRPTPRSSPISSIGNMWLRMSGAL
jgi:DNA topoisomerase-1